MNNALGSSVDVNAVGSGISISNVRRAGAVAFVAASLVAFCIFFASPTLAHAQDGASMLNWGDATYDYFTGALLSSDQILIQDGGTYAVLIGISKGALVQIQDIQNGYVTQYPSPGYGPLYFLPDPAHSAERDLIATIGGTDGTTTLAWQKPGTYELDVYKMAGPVLGDNVPLWQDVLHILVGAPAYAQTVDPPYQTIRFTIVDENTIPKESNVLFIPGIESSRLYMSSGGTEHQLWEPGFLSDQADVKSLYLNGNGKSINQIYTKAGAVIDTQGAHVIGGITFKSDDIYKTFLEQLSQMKASGTIADYLTFPYDWRMTPADVVNKGVQYDDGMHYIDQELIGLAATSKTGKVTIVAHSNGGLVAKDLMLKLQSEGKANLVDKILLVDVPQTGTPEAIAAMLHGDFQDIPAKAGFMASQANARGLSENMPDAYDLLPSAAYFAKVATPVVDFSSAPILKSTSGVTANTIKSTSDFASFLTGTGGRKKPSYLDIETPDVLSPALLSSAGILHTNLDSWSPPAGVQVIQIAGWGIDTPSEVTYSEELIAQCQSGLCTVVPVTRHVVNMTKDGDGVVVIPSEVATTTWPTYFINIPEYNHANGLNINHADITESQPLQSLFSLLLSSTSPKSLPNYVTTAQPSPTDGEGDSLRLRVLSPVSMDVYDSLGDHTGMAPNPNSRSDDLYVEEQIPGSYYQQYGEGQYIGLPVDGTYTVKLHGTGVGTFTFEITPVTSGVAGAPISFSGIPVTASSTATIKLNSANPTATSFVVDENGDGKTILTIASSTQLADPLSYTKMIFANILGMDIGPIVKIQLEAKIMNVGYLIAKSTSWDNDDSDSKDTNTKDALKVRVSRKLNLIETYVENEVSKPVPKLLMTEQISSVQGTQILGMIEELKSMISHTFK